MAAIPLGKGAYKRLDSPEIRLVNMAFEVDPTNVEDQVSLISRPGLQRWATPGTTPVRGLHHFDAGGSRGFLTAVTDRIYGYDPNGNQYAGGVNLFPGSGACTFAVLGDISTLYALACNGAGLYSWGYNTTALSFPDGAGVTSVDVLANRFLASRAGSGRFYWTDLGTTNFDALNYATAESAPDNLVGLKVLGDELWLFGTASIEVWAVAGDPDLPFQRIIGRQFGLGLLTLASLVKLGGAPATLFFVGAEERKVYRVAPNPEPISDPAVEAKLAKAAVADINAFGAIVDGHTYYVLNMGAQGSMAYDTTTGQWCEWASNGRQDFRGRYSAPMGDGRYLVGDVSGALHVLSADAHSDNEDPLIRDFTGWLPLNAKARFDNVILEITVGNADAYPDNPKVGLCFSDDGGKTWSDWEYVSLGHAGEFDTTVMWTRLGAAGRPGRIFWFRCSEALPITARSAKYNERP